MKLKRWTFSSRSIDLKGIVPYPIVALSMDTFYSRRKAAAVGAAVQENLRENPTWRTDVVAHKVGEAPVWPSDGSNQ